MGVEKQGIGKSEYQVAGHQESRVSGDKGFQIADKT
jgi:hypothetical protein